MMGRVFAIYEWSASDRKSFSVTAISLFEEFLFEKLLITIYYLVHCQVAVTCYLYRMYYFVQFLKVIA